MSERKKDKPVETKKPEPEPTPTPPFPEPEKTPEPEKPLVLRIAEWYETATPGTTLEEAAAFFNMPADTMKTLLIDLKMTDKIAYPR